MDRSLAMEMPRLAEPKLRILHVLRAPVGGLFRHVRDLAQEQIARGHEVGLIADSITGGDNATEILNQLKPSLALGLLRIPMYRQPNPFDIATALRIRRYAQTLTVDVIHGHGAKGGLYARFPAFGSPSSPPVRAYTPHGGSFGIAMPYGLQRLYMFVERLLEPFTDVYLFESAFAASRFATYIGKTHATVKINPNGIGPAEFAPVEPRPDAADLLYVGELRKLKGIELLIDSIVELNKRYGKKPRLLFVGNGPDKDCFMARTTALGLQDQVRFMHPMPAREAFQHGHILVLPSRGESLPYIVLEAAGAELPIVATNVGDIGIILSPYSDRLVPPDDLDRLVTALRDMLEKEPGERQRESADLALRTAERFTISKMVDTVLAAYREALERNKSRQPGRSTPSLALPS